MEPELFHVKHPVSAAELPVFHVKHAAPSTNLPLPAFAAPR